MKNKNEHQDDRGRNERKAEIVQPQESNMTKELGTKPIAKLLLKFSIPAVIAMIVNAIYNIVDRIFVGKYVGENALAGLTITFPVMMLIFAFAGLVGVGGAA